MTAIQDFFAYWWDVVKRAGWMVLTGFGFGHPGQIGVSLLLLFVGFVQFWAAPGRTTEEVFSRWDALMDSAISVGILAGAMFVATLLIVPWRLDREMRSRLGTSNSLAVDVDPGELIIAPVQPWFFGTQAAEIASGLYIFVRSVRLTNQSTEHHVVLDIVLRRLRDGKVWRYDVHPLPKAISNAMWYSQAFLRLLHERALPPMVNLGPAQGDAGSLIFRLPHPGSNALDEKLTELHQCDFELQATDKLSGLMRTRSIIRNGEHWRVAD